MTARLSMILTLITLIAPYQIHGISPLTPVQKNMWESLAQPLPSLVYVPGRNTRYVAGRSKPKQSLCIFCLNDASRETAEPFVLGKYKHCYASLNAFPYAEGHILIAPYRHVSSLDQLTREERSELMELVSASSKILKEVLPCDGLNVGINMGEWTGASIPDHVHIHVVPRWKNDAAFIHIIGRTNLVGWDVLKSGEKFRPYFQKLTLE